MKILIIGATGMIGRKLTERLIANGRLKGETISAMTLADVVEPAPPEDAPTSIAFTTRTCDLSMPGEAEALVADRPDVIFHLAAIVSGEAEAEFDKGYRINLDGTRALLEAIRALGTCPRLVFTSSIAVFGAPFPEAIPDDYHHTPLTSYGVQKACSELMLTDYTRKGFVDGVGIRLPTIVVRPGKPNLAASGFFSNILREPLAGKEAVLPVSADVRHWMASPRAAVGFLIHAAEIDGAAVGPHRNLTMPGLSATVGEMLDALERIGGPQRRVLVREEPDEGIKAIVANWPRNFEPARATELGFRAESSMDELILAHVEDEGIEL